MKEYDYYNAVTWKSAIIVMQEHSMISVMKNTVTLNGMIIEIK